MCSVAMIFQIIIGLVLIASSHQRSDGEIKAWFFTQTLDCNKDFSISPEELLMMKKHKLPDTESAKCLTACVLKRVHWIDDKGNFDVPKSDEWAEKEFKDEPKRLEGAKSVFDMCKTVNDAAVTDGEKGCDRAYMLSKCLIDNAPKGGFSLHE